MKLLILSAWFLVNPSFLLGQNQELAIKSQQGKEALNSGKFEEAAEQFETVSKLDPQNARGWYGAGKAYEALTGKAFDELEKIAPESAYWFALVADSRMVQQQFQSAFYFYKKALEKGPRLRGIHLALGEIYRKTGHSDWARKEEERELALDAPDCASEKLVCDFLAGRFQEIVRALRAKVTAESCYWRSRAYNQLAVAAFEKLACLPPSFEMHQLRAEIHQNQRRYLEAVAEWKKALELSPGNPMARRELAVSLFLSRDYESAKPLIEELLKEDPESAQLNWLAGDLLFNQQRPQEAIPFLNKAVQLDSNWSAVRASLGRAYLALGEISSAIPHLKAALAIDEDGSIHYQLARAYQSTGQAEAAKQVLEKYQEIQKLRQQESAKLKDEVRITPP